MAGDSQYEYDYNSNDPAKLASYWSTEMAMGAKWMENWCARSKKIEERYLDERGAAETNASVSSLNLFWSNTEVMMAALFAKKPDLDIHREFRDPMDDVARVGANILERTIRNDIVDPTKKDIVALKPAVLDRLVVGLGQLWVRYEADTAPQQAGNLLPGAPPNTPAPGGMQQQQQQPGQYGPPVQGQPPQPPQGAQQPPQAQQPTQQDVAEPQPMEVITDERTPFDHVRWEDFRMSPCRAWVDCRWVARRVYMDKAKADKRFGPVICAQLNFQTRSVDSKPATDEMQRLTTFQQAEIWEIWCKMSNRLYWWSKDVPVILDFRPDQMRFPGFWPCPQPLLGPTTTGNILPKCEYYLAQDQYEELDLVCTRMHLLTEAIKVVGVYDKTNEVLGRVLQQGSMNQMIPADNWAMLAEKGGIKGAVDWFPLEIVINTLEKLGARKQELIGEIYQVLGISDIMRGMSNPNETLGAQNLKAQFGGARIGKIQFQIAQFVTEAYELKAHVMCKRYQPQTFMLKSQIDRTDDKKYAAAAIQLLKDPSQKYRIAIAADSMASPEWVSEKQQRAETIQAVSQFIGMSMPLIQQHPESAPYMIKVLQWGVAGFKGGEELEGVLDEAFNAMIQPKPPKQPSPMEVAELREKQSIADKNKAVGEKEKATAQQTRIENVMMTGNPLLGMAPPPDPGAGPTGAPGTPGGAAGPPQQSGQNAMPPPVRPTPPGQGAGPPPGPMPGPGPQSLQ